MKTRILYTVLAVLCAVCALVAISLFIMAICMLELGRVIFYLVIAVLLIEGAVLSALKLRKGNDKANKRSA